MGAVCRCVYCKQLEPVWNELAQRLDGVVHVAKVCMPCHVRAHGAWC